jgi:sialate O-acetylesterase
MRILSIGFAAALFASAVQPAQAELRAFGLFRDNAVLQHGAPVPVWGTTDRPETVTVRFAEQQLSCEPQGGKWHITLSPLPINTAESRMTITQGSEKLELNNLLVGDVWVCSGQSNMFMPLRDTEGAAQAIANSQNELLRLFFINPFPIDEDHPQEPRDFVDGQWQISSPTTVDGFSAVGYHFGRELQHELKTPVGLIESTLGGTSAERWTSRDSMESNPELRDASEGLKYDLYNGMIAPLTPFPVRGVVWYQGESNAPRAWKYRILLPALIDCWRKAWNQPDMPFLVVQLPGYERIEQQPSESDWADLRDAQLHVAQTVPGVTLVVTIDLGDEREIHPRRKREVGQRLALAALAKTYGRDIPHSGPIYESVAIEGNRAVLRFKHVGKGLEARGGSPVGFTIAGSDRKFHNAQAEIQDDKVVVWSHDVPEPHAVRYGWAKNPVVNLWNRDGLPASPFRTDDFPLPTRDNK